MSDSPIALEHHLEPHQQHHFATMEQQKHTASLGMWLFLATELMFFGGMFCAYLVYRWSYPVEFGVGSRTLNLPLGAANTAVLICSSLTVALSIRATQMGKRTLTVILLLLTMVFGLTFLVIKGFEWNEKYEKHHIPGASFRLSAEDLKGVNVDPQNMQDFQARTQTFYSLYFAMTGLHALHMIIGVGLFLYLTYATWKGTYTPGYYTPLENGGLYWHFVDIVWIYLFPLLYLIDRNLQK